jgi:murein DD-endopeptidase MepM/ murein hydrolase activator NlpD
MRPARLALGFLLLALLLASPAARAGQPLRVPTPEGAVGVALAAYGDQLPAVSTTPVRRSGDYAYALATPLDGHGRPLADACFALLAQAGPDGWAALGPGLVLAKEYNALLAAMPADLLDDQAKAHWRLDEATAQANFTGHKLPWGAGLIGYLTQKDGAGHENRADFDIQGLAAAGNVVASKPGTVVFVKQSSNYGSCSDANSWPYGNMVVIQHGPSEYSWYIHLAYQSVPVKVGDHVDNGTKIGVEGQTGYACGVHVHYLASTGHSAWPADPNSPTAYPSPTGATAVDFAESTWAGLTVGQTYTSQNSAPSADKTPPDGALTAPAEGSTVAARTLHLAAWTSDAGSGLKKAHFIAYYGGKWQQVGPDFTTSPFSYDWDLCTAGVPEGPLQIGFDAWDNAGNVAYTPNGIRHLTWAYDCSVQMAHLQVTSPLALAPNPPFAGQVVTATYTLKNTGGLTVTVQSLGVTARGPDCGDWACAHAVDFPAQAGVTLGPGAEVTYRQARPLVDPGRAYFAAPSYQDMAGAWHWDLDGGAPVDFSVFTHDWRVYAPAFLLVPMR